MTTIKDLCKKLKFEDIQRAIEYHYPKDKNNYLSVYEFILECEIIKQLDTDSKLVVRHWGFHNIEPTSPLFEDNDDGYYDVFTNDDYSVSFIPWKKLVSKQIEKETLKYNSPEEILAHFIWEITFYGNQEQTQKINSELKETIKKYDEGKLDRKTDSLEKLLKDKDKYGKL